MLKRALPKVTAFKKEKLPPLMQRVICLIMLTNGWVIMPKISLNMSALKLVETFCREAEKYCISIERTESGATLIDAGLESEGGFLAGEMITEICLGGYGKAKILPIQYGDVVLPSVYVQTDYPALSTLASQFASRQY